MIDIWLAITPKRMRLFVGLCCFQVSLAKEVSYLKKMLNKKCNLMKVDVQQPERMRRLSEEVFD